MPPRPVETTPLAGGGDPPDGAAPGGDPPDVTAAGTALDAPELLRPLWRRLGLLFWLPLGWILVLGVAALAAPLLPLDDPDISDFTALARAPGGEHWLGTDALGRDLLARVVWGTRVSMAVGTLSIALGALVGGTLGLLAGYFRGRLDSVVMAVIDAMLSFPGLVLLLTLTTFMGRSLMNVVFALGIVMVPVITRLIRANTMVHAQRDFVLAARAMGARNGRIILREIMPNVAVPLFAFAFIGVAITIVAEGSLSFLGLGIDPATPTWGNIIAAGRQDIETSPHIVFVPSGVLFLTVFAFNLAGDRMREELDVRESML